MQTYTYTLKLKTNSKMKKELNKRLRKGAFVYSETLKELLNRERKLKRDPLYKKAYKLEKGKERNAILNELDKKYKLSKFESMTIASKKRKDLCLTAYIPSRVSESLGNRAYLAFRKKLFVINNTSRVVRPKMIDSLVSSGDNAIRVKNGKVYYGVSTGKLKSHLLEIPIIYKNDEYEKEILRGKIVQNRILKKIQNGKENFYLQMILKSEVAPRKYDTNDMFGNVGIDIGTSTVAISSYYETKLEELAPGIDKKEKEIALLNRKLERQRRANNPQNYNEDGTIVPGKKTWTYSKKYYQTKNKLRKIKTKQAETRALAHKTLANEIVGLGDRFVVEQMSFAGLQKRAKETKVNEKTNKIQSKKRFGATIGHRAPAMLISLIEQKCNAQGKTFIKADTKTVKASQFDHLTEEYTKHSLSTRVKFVGDDKVQRDLYSAFLLAHVEDDKKTVNVNACKSNFNTFLENQKQTMKELSTTLGSTGAKKFFEE